MDAPGQPDRRAGHHQVGRALVGLRPYWLQAYLLCPFRPLCGANPGGVPAGRRVGPGLLGRGGAWALAGVTVLPILTGRVDVQGALCLPVFAYFLLRSPRWPLFAAVFIIVSELEIFGTSFGNWYWMPVAPWTHIPSGNPPSVIAGGYCVIDGSVLLVTWLVYRLGL